jgi:hypothetical protein
MRLYSTNATTRTNSPVLVISCSTQSNTAPIMSPVALLFLTISVFGLDQGTSAAGLRDPARGDLDVFVLVLVSVAGGEDLAGDGKVGGWALM